MDAEIDLRAVFSFIRRKIVLILVISVAVLGIASIYIFTLTPIYTSTALVMVDPSNRNLLLDQSQTGPASAADARIEAEVFLVKSHDVLLMVTDRENLINEEEFKPRLGFTARILSFLRLREPTLPTPQDALNSTLSKLDSMIQVFRYGSTYLISITAYSESPDMAARLANAMAKAYIDVQLTAKVQSTIDARDVLMRQVEAARQSVIASDGSFDRFIDDNLTSIIDQTNNPELASIQKQITQLSSLRQSTTAEVASLQAQLSGQDYSGLSQRLADQAIAELERQRQDILGQIEASGTSPAVVDLRAELNRIEQQMQQRATTSISTLQTQLQTNQASETQLRESLRTAILASGLSPDVLTQIYDLQQKAEFARQEYDQLVTRAQQLQSESTLQMADSRLVAPAPRPGGSDYPNTRSMLSISALLGLALGIGVAFLHEHFVGGVTTEDQLAAIARTKSALTVPKSKPPLNQNSIADLVISTPLSAFSESIRRIRTSIDQNLIMSMKEARNRATIIMVASTSPGEGKTTMSLSIARSYSLAGRKTLLIDCDLRRPAVHRQLGVEPSDGLATALMSEDPSTSLGNAFTHDGKSDLLTLIGSRSSSAATDQLITGRSFDNLLSAAAKTFDVVILDTPPIGPVVDGIYIARKVDAVVMVVQWASTPQQDVRKALLAIEPSLQEHASVVPVLNQQDLITTPYYRRYGSYYTDRAAD